MTRIVNTALSGTGFLAYAFVAVSVAAVAGSCGVLNWAMHRCR